MPDQLSPAQLFPLPGVEGVQGRPPGDAPAEPEPEEPINWPAYFIRQAALQEQELKAALAEPEPKQPTVMEIIELADEIEKSGLGQVDLVRAALARWGNHNTSRSNFDG